VVCDVCVCAARGVRAAAIRFRDSERASSGSRVASGCISQNQRASGPLYVRALRAKARVKRQVKRECEFVLVISGAAAAEAVSVVCRHTYAAA
jgi:hypothetical protein